MTTIKQLVAGAALCCFMPLAMAMTDNCQKDQREMQRQISRWYSITTQNNYQVQRVGAAADHGASCSADCTSYGYALTCVWQKGNWGNTLVAN